LTALSGRSNLIPWNTHGHTWAAIIFGKVNGYSNEELQNKLGNKQKTKIRDLPICHRQVFVSLVQHYTGK
jgi:hypothetical protein